MTTPTYTVDPTAVAARKLEVTAADFDGGVNSGGSFAPGIGINIGGGELTEDPDKWTLLDQNGDARTPQNSQTLGGDAVPVLVSDNDSTDGETGIPTDEGDATLEALATGWTAGAISP